MSTSFCAFMHLPQASVRANTSLTSDPPNLLQLTYTSLSLNYPQIPFHL